MLCMLLSKRKGERMQVSCIAFLFHRDEGVEERGMGGAVDTEEIRPGVAIYARIIGYAIHWESDVICKRSEEMEGGQSIKK